MKIYYLFLLLLKNKSPCKSCTVRDCIVVCLRMYISWGYLAIGIVHPGSCTISSFKIYSITLQIVCAGSTYIWISIIGVIQSIIHETDSNLWKNSRKTGKMNLQMNKLIYKWDQYPWINDWLIDYLIKHSSKSCGIDYAAKLYKYLERSRRHATLAPLLHISFGPTIMMDLCKGMAELSTSLLFTLCKSYFYFK